ncbi:MAG TPA: acetate kinase [Patescibacteria group bacterium]|jgi:acetate kinase
MARLILVLNPGSASKKLALYRDASLKLAAHAEYEDGKVVAELSGAVSERFPLPDGLDHVTEWFVGQARSAGVLKSREDIDAVVLRVVASGEAFRKHRVIDEHYERQLRTAYERSPLHLGPALAELDDVRKELPAAPVIGASDSAFHVTLPEVARRYAIPSGDAERRGLFRYGFHGLSLQSVVRDVRKRYGRMPARTVVCHLGSGASVTALKGGKSVDTSMGATPMEGLVMSTRSGDVDPGILLEMAAERSARQVENDLNHNAGLLALGGSGDIRELLKREQGGDKRAALALDVFAYRVRKYVGAYAAALGGLDLLVFTGTVGLRSFPMRERICADLGYLGIGLDKARNRRAGSGDEVGKPRRKPPVLVLECDEAAEMARTARDVLKDR